MPRKAKTLTLTVEERQQLETLVERGRDWQERRRAQTVLLLDKGLSPSKVSALHKVHPDTVANHRDAWLARGFEGLRDLPRCGAPPQLSVALAQAVCGWAREGAHTAPELQSRLAAEHGSGVGVGSAKRFGRRRVSLEAYASQLKKSATRPSSVLPRQS